MLLACELRPVTTSYAEGKTPRTPYLSAFVVGVTQITQSSYTCVCVSVRIYAHTCTRVLHNLRNTHLAHTLAALIPSACSLVTILYFSYITNIKKRKTDSNYSKKEALLKGSL
jgi:hypothetical protein